MKAINRIPIIGIVLVSVLVFVMASRPPIDQGQQQENSIFSYELCDVGKESDLIECDFLGWYQPVDIVDVTISNPDLLRSLK